MTSDPQIAILSVYRHRHPQPHGSGVRMFQALSQAGINVEIVSTSEVRVNVVVATRQGPAGLNGTAEAFADVIV